MADEPSGQGRGLLGGAMDALRGASRTSGSRGSWNSGKLEFDTSGVREFTTEITKAEKAVGKFVGHFKELDRILKGMDQKKIDALGKIGGTGGGGGSYISAGTLPQTPGSPRNDASTDNNQSTPDSDRSSGERGHNTNRFGGGGGIAGAYFASELIQRAGSGLAQSAAYHRTTSAAIDYANTLGVMRGSASYNQMGGARAWADIVGATSTEDAIAARTRSNASWGQGLGGAAQARFIRQAGAMNMVNPNFGGVSGAYTSWEQAFASPQAQWALIQQGIRPAISGGQPRPMNEMYSDILLRATGKSSFDELSRREAEATFGYGGKGRQNLSVIAPGASAEMIDYLATLGTSASGGVGIGRALNSRAMRNTIAGKQSLGVAESTEQSAQQTRQSRDAMINAIEVENKVRDTLEGVRTKLNDFGVYVSEAAGPLARLAGAASAAAGFLGDNSGEGGGGAGGVVSTALGTALGSRLARSGAGRTAGRLLGRGLMTGAGSLAGEWAGGSVGRRVGGDTGADVGGFLGAVGGGAAVGAGIGVWGAGVGAIPGAAIGGLTGAAGWGLSKLLGDPVDIGDPGDEARVPSNLDPDFANRLRRLFHDAPFDLTITSGRRSTERQRELYADYLAGKGNLAAKPGTSKHEFGTAVDVAVNGGKPNNNPAWKAWLDANAGKYGLKHGGRFKQSEWWHIESGGAGVAESTGRSPTAPVANQSVGSAFTARHSFAAKGITSTSSRVSDMSLAPGFEHAFGGGVGGGGSAMAVGSTGGSPVGGSDGMLGVLRKAGFSGEGLRLAYAVMMGESQGNPNAHNPDASTGDNSYGLFQINMLGKLGPARLKQYGLSSNNDLFNPQTNADVAFKMSAGGTNWQPWSAYKNGSYKQYYRSDIGDPTAGPGPAAAGGGGGRGVSIGNINMRVQVLQATEEEATRLAKMVIGKIEEQAKMASLGSV